MKQPQLQLQIVELREMLWVPNAGCQLFGEIRAKWARARVTYFIARDKNWEGYLLGKKQKSLPFRIVQYLFAGSRCWVKFLQNHLSSNVMPYCYRLFILRQLQPDSMW